jgi:uracil-DNA glycosylase family 4
MSLFSPTTWQDKKVPLPLVAQCGSCGLHKHVHSPFMEVSGKGRKKILIVAEAPGSSEDDQGIQLVGNAGCELIRLLHRIGIDMREDCWLTNAVICRPMGSDGNRTPTDDEISYCRPNLVKTIKELNPVVIIPMGGPAVRSLLPLVWRDETVEEVSRWVGWEIPCQKLNSWVCPTYHPSYLLRSKDKVVEVVMRRHLKRAFRHTQRPYREVPDYKSWVSVIMDDRIAADWIGCDNFTGQTPVAFDYETTTLKPDGPKAEIICCALSDGECAIAFPWHGRVIPAMKDFLRSNTPKVASNCKFEDRWSRTKLGIAPRNWHWDTMLAAHWLNCHKGVTGLKFQAFVLLGQPDYSSHLEDYISGPGSNEPNRLREVEPRELMTYCGMDAILEAVIAKKQMEKLK